MENKSELKIENAIITSTMLGYEDHGILTCGFQLDRQLGSQGFGYYALAGKDITSNYGIEFVKKILNTVGVDTWEELKGKHIRIKVGRSWGSKIVAIGNFMSDVWFDPEEFSKSYRKD